MKKDDVVRALQRCFDSKSDCQGCPVKEECDRNPSEVTTKLEKTALSIIRKQERQIEELKLKIQLTNKASENLIAGYRDDYDRAFERLKAQQREIEQLKTNAEILARGVRDFNKENYGLSKKIKKLKAENERFESNMRAVLEIEKKQAKIDVLNELKERTYRDSVYYPEVKYEHKYVHMDDIDEMIEELKK